MNQLLLYVQNKYHYSNYQKKKKKFLFKTIFSEISKILLMGILFFHHLDLYLFALLVMLCLRCCTGGFHFYTYWRCLAASVLFLAFPVMVLPQFFIPLLLRMLLLTTCLLGCYVMGPVPSKYRPMPTSKTKKGCRIMAGGCIILYSFLIYIFPENPLCNAGFWIIILHTLQLIAAKVKRKEAV